DDGVVKRALHVRRDVRVRQKRDPISIQRFLEIVDEDLVAGDFEVVEVIEEVRLPPANEVRRAPAGSHERGAPQGIDANGIENPVSPDRCRHDQPDEAHRCQQRRLVRPVERWLPKTTRFMTKRKMRASPRSARSTKIAKTMPAITGGRESVRSSSP